MKSLIDSVPGQGSRTYVAIAILVIIELGKQLGIVVDQLDSNAVNAVQVIVAGLAGIFLRAGK